MKNIAVIMGGISSERDISISSGKAVSNALKKIGYNVKEIILNDTSINFDKINIDAVFITLHGSFGEDGRIQSLLDKKKIPYTGSSAESCRLSFDKIKSRALLKKNNIPIPLGEVIENSSELSLSFPVIIKPPTEGSSIGCYLVRNKKDWEASFNITQSISKKVLVEKYIEGRELTVGIIGDKILPAVEIKPYKGWYDFNAKYKNINTKYIVPANLDENILNKINNITKQTFRIFGASGFGRVDFRLSNENKLFVLELNAIPGFTKSSLLPKAAKAAGISFEKLCDLIICNLLES